MTEMQFLTYETLPDARPESAEGTAPKTIALPHPDQRSGLPLMTALSFRSSNREFAPSPLSMGTLGELLWAADGVNRPVSGGRTAPSPHAFNEIDIYVALPNGVYRYDAPNHQLLLKHAIEARNLTGYQDFVGKAPLELVYVVRTSSLQEMPQQQRERFSAVTAGAIAQNVALYCASAGLVNVIRGWINHRLLADALRLNEDELPILAQTVGLPSGQHA
ncbi:SagB/ThcOx family dehydrogenase [Paraburkholderia madseniana]|uniref:SagB/ThcOx family dehydrogenase n=1 Tax=Paraburkholderia madseniana TaxID=2599607 RepID=A0A6N6WEZ2_9BURK|nr:nitroreductase family protein [Paraburkholderia madseniana]KAE8759232.1 SagB/ThcOx family dehydrogenase [Paraburkholderia madseniana]